MTDMLTRLTADDPHKVRGYVVTVTAVDTVTGTCTADPGDGDPVAEVPYFGGIPAVGEVLVALLFDELLVVIAGGSGGGGSVTTELVGAVDLNTVLTPGLYTQSQTAEATLAANYPIAYAGLLEVFTNAGNVAAPSSMVWQRYSTYAGASWPNQRFIRASYQGTWKPWAPDSAQQVQSGYVNFGSVGANSSVSASVTFPDEFPEIPIVTISAYSTTPHARGCGAAAISTTGFTAYFGNWGSASVTGQAGWVARIATV